MSHTLTVRQGDTGEDMEHKPAHISTTSHTHVEQVHNTVGLANLSNDLLARPATVKHHTTKVCETFGDLNIL